MDNYDIDTIISLFRERGNSALFLVNGNEPDKHKSILDRFPIFEKYNCFSFSFNLKQGKNIKQLLKDNQYTEKFSTDDLNLVLNSDITTTSAFIIFFNIFSFFYYSDDNDQKIPDSPSMPRFENDMTIDVLNLFMRCLINLAHLQHHKNSDTSDKEFEIIELPSSDSFLPPEYYDRLIFFFFRNILITSLHFFDTDDGSASKNDLTESILLFLAFFDNQKYLPANFFEMFISFIFKAKIQDFSEHVLGLLIKMFKESRPLVLQNDVSKIIEYIHPFLTLFNQRALDLIVIISNTYKTLSKSVIDCFSNLSLSVINVLLEETPKIVIEEEEFDAPYNIDDIRLNENNSSVDFIKELSFNFIETKSRFEKGFVCPRISSNGIDWILQNLDNHILMITSRLIVTFVSSNEIVLDSFFNTFKEAILKINQSYYFDALAIFYHFATSFQKTYFISKYFDFLLNPKLFNEKESIFTSLSDVKNAFRNAAFSILSDYPETICAFIAKSLNPLFRSELLFRVKNRANFAPIILDVANVCSSLRTIDVRWHCEEIEKARCCSFCFLSDLFLSMFNSYKYFDEVMQFCLEKSVTNIFINLYKESTLNSRNFELLHKVYKFIMRLLNLSLELSWKFIKITDSIFDKRNYLVPQMKQFFVLIMNYTLKLKYDSELAKEVKNIDKRSFKAVRMSLKYISLFETINPHHLSLITSNISHHMSEELFIYLLERMGKPPKFNNKIDCFMIKNPIFISVLLFSSGLTQRVMRIFTNLCVFSVRNSCFFNDHQIDSILIQILQNKEKIVYRNVIFDDFYYDRSISKQALQELLFLTCSYKTDLRIVSQLLKDKKFIPFVNSLLTNYQNGNLPVLSIPSMSAENCCKLNYSDFTGDFSFSFWIIYDINFLTSFPTENVEIITVNNGVYRFGFYLQGAKLRAYYSNGKTRSDVNLSFFKTNKCSWTFVSTSFFCKKKSFDTFCYEMPMNKSEFDGIVFDDQFPIEIRINSSLQKRNYNPKNNYYSFYSFPENEFVGFVKDVRFYNRTLSTSEVFDLFYRPLNHDVIPTLCLSNLKDFKVNYSHFDNLFNVLRRETSIAKLVKILLKHDQEESICYEILGIIGKLANVIKIPTASLMIFLSDSNHYEFKNTFNCFYFIFQNIKDNQTMKVKFFNVFISNVYIWCHFVNFKDILFFYQTKLIIENADLLVDNSGLNLFLYYFGKIDSVFWSDYVIFLKRIFEKSPQKDEQKFILNFINKKFNKIKNHSSKFINDQSNLANIILNQLKVETSNITAFYPSICQSKQQIIVDENTIFRTKKVSEIHPNKFASTSKRDRKKAKELKKVDEVPKEKKIDLLDDIPDDFKDPNFSEGDQISTENQNENIDSDDIRNINERDRLYLIYLLQLIDHKSFIFTKNEDAFSILLQLLKIKDLQITENVLLTLYKISSEQPISLFTLIAYNNINKQLFPSIYEFLKSKINEYPNFFPLLCSVAISMQPQPNCSDFLEEYQLLENTTVAAATASKNNNNKGSYDPWYLFPIMLGFSLTYDSLLFLFKILLQNSNKKWETIEKMIILFDFLSNYFDNRIIVAQFLEYIYEYNNDFIYEIIRYFAMVLFAHPYLSSFPSLNLLHLIINETLILKSIVYDIGIHLNQRGKMDQSFEILLRLIDACPSDQNEKYEQLISTLNSIFRNEIRNSYLYFEMCSSCDQLVKDYKSIFEENFNEIFSVLRDMIQNNRKTNKKNKTKYVSPSSRMIGTDDLEIINNRNDHIHIINGKRLSSQYDCVFRQMIYRNNEKNSKDIETFDSNCSLLYNGNFCPVKITLDQNENKVTIITPTSQRYFDLCQDVLYTFKRPESDICEIFTKFGKRYRLKFCEKRQMKDIAQYNSSKLFEDVSNKWSKSEMTNFEFLMYLNALADNIHLEKAIFPSPLYKRKAVPDGKWNLDPINNKDEQKEQKTKSKSKKFSLLNNKVKEKNATSNARKRNNAFSNMMSKIKFKKDDNNINDDDDDGNEDVNDNNNENVSDNEDDNDNFVNELDFRNVDPDIINYCYENQVVPARYFYDFELYNDEFNSQKNSQNENDNDKNNHKIEFELMYNMRKCIENYESISSFAEDYLGIKVSSSRKLIERKNCPGIFQNKSRDNLIFAVSLKSHSQNDCSSFLAINSNFHVKYFSIMAEEEKNQSFLSNFSSIDVNLSKPTILNDKSLFTYITNNYQQSSMKAVNETDSLILDNVSNKCQLFQLDDGIATFDPNNKILIIFTTSSIDTISSSPSPLSLTSPSPLDSSLNNDDFALNSHRLTSLILSTSISDVYCKTYTTPLSDPVYLLCGNTERQFYTVSPTVVYSNNRFFAQFSSTIKILKVSMIFNVIVIATEDGKVHILSSTSGKKIKTIDTNIENDNFMKNQSKSWIQMNEISEIVITHNFGFLLIVMKNGNLFLYTINGTLIKATQIETKHNSDSIRFWFTFDTTHGVDYIGFVTNNEKIFYFEAFYPSTLVQMTSNEKFKNVLAVNYDKFSRCFLVLNNNCEISVVTHNVLVVPINYDLI